MSQVTKTLHRQKYAAIDASSPEQSQIGRKILITGGSGVIGRGAAEAFVTAMADTVVITSRSAEKAVNVVQELQSKSNGRTKVYGYRYELCDSGSVASLWNSLARDGIVIDTLILNATNLIPVEAEGQNLASIFGHFESGVRNQLINIDRFRQQGSTQNKVLLYISTNSTHMHELPLHYTASSSPRIAMTRIMSDLAINTPVTDLQVLSIHPGFVLTGENMKHGITRDTFPVPLDDESLPANFFVWASTKKAAFLHGRFVWANWDVDELMAMKDKIEADRGFLRMGLQGVASQDFPMLIGGMGRSI